MQKYIWMREWDSGSLLEKTIKVEDWGIQADVYHYRILHHQLQDAEARMAQLAAEIHTIRGAQELSKGQLESA